MATVRMRVVKDAPKGATVRSMEPTAEIDGNGITNYACGGGCKNILLHHQNSGTIYAYFGPSDVVSILRCPFCGSLNVVPKG